MPMFSDQIALVTGASSGIGKAIAQSLAFNGATVCLIGRRCEALNAAVSEIQQSGGKAFPCILDLIDDTAIWKLRSMLEEKFGRVNLLIHGAGAFAMARIKTATIADFDHLYRTNVRAPYVLTQAFLPLLVPHKSQIVFINSTAGLSAKANTGQYAATKFALKAIADSLRAEINTNGIRVLSVFPGRTATPMQEAIFALEGRPYDPELLLQPEEIADVVINSLKLPYRAEVTDVSIRGIVNMSTNR